MSRARLREGFPLPARSDGHWGDHLAAFGPVDGHQVHLHGTCELPGLALHGSSLVGPRRGVVSTATYHLHDLPERSLLEAWLGVAGVASRPNRGQAWEVAETWVWRVDDVGLTVSRYGAPRDGAVAGVFLSCGDERLARPFLPELTADAPWRQPGRIEPLRVRELVPATHSDDALVLARPGLVRPASWAPTGWWRSAGSWGLADGAVTSVFRDDAVVALRLVRILPARGRGGATLEHDGLPVLTSRAFDGLDALVDRLVAAGHDVTIHEEMDA